MKRDGAMKRGAKCTTLSGVAALTLFDIAAAQAQTPPPINWTGFYLGVHAGERWSNVYGMTPSLGGFPIVTPGFPGTATFPTLTTNVAFQPNNGVFGGQGGFNQMIGLNFLMGLEVDYTLGKGNSSAVVQLTDAITKIVSTNTFGVTVDWSTSVRSRFGFVSGPWLFYATAGVSMLHVSASGFGGFSGTGCFITCADSFVTSSSFNFAASKTVIGPIVGAGIEYLFADHFLFRVEYLFADYGRVNFGNTAITSSYRDNFNCFCTVTATSISNISASVTTQVVRLGLSFKIP
jgi:outer membrane immunogenic protein